MNSKPTILTEIVHDDYQFEMILVQGGTYWMGDDEGEYGDEKPAHEVQLGDFWMGRYPVTQGLWEAVMGEGSNPSFFGGAERPVETVSWDDAQAFCKKLNAISSRQYRLPTETEWEYAARGGNRSKGFRYAGSNHLKEVGWYWQIAHRETQAVGRKRSNELGLYDMSGNVYEWCADWGSDDYYQECRNQGVIVNPKGPDEGSERVLRGGCWDLVPELCRVTCRLWLHPVIRSSDVGFRLALSPS